MSLVGDQWKLAGAVFTRAHWQRRATQLVTLDCHLLELLPWEDPALVKLHAVAYGRLTRQISDEVACACDLAGRETSQEIEHRMAKSIWRFAKTLQPNLEPFSAY